MITRLKKVTSAGDTIVEVMIVLAVLGLAFSTSYAIANKGLQQSRNAEEHSEALGIINSQVELLRSVFAKQAGGTLPISPNPFCLASPTTTNSANFTSIITGVNKFNENIATDNLTPATYPVPCTQNNLYNVSIVNRSAGPDGGLFDFRVRWEGLGTLGRQQEELTYKIGTIIPNPNGGYTDPAIPTVPATPSLIVNLTINGATGTVDVTVGQSVTYVWSTNNPATATCTGSGNTPSGVITGIPLPNAYSLLAYTATAADAGKTYTLTLSCTDPVAGSSSQTVAFKVAAYVPSLTPLYRSWSAAATDHFYSTSSTEGIAPNGAYTLEGIAGRIDTVQGPGEQPLYRLYSNGQQDHFYTISAAEANLAEGLGYAMEGVIGYVPPWTGSCPTGSSPMYRTYSSAWTDHFYTASLAEYNSTWPTYDYPEGVVFCVYN